MEYFVISAKFVPLKYYTLSSQLRRLTSFSVGLFGSANSVTRSYSVMRKSCIAENSNMSPEWHEGVWVYFVYCQFSLSIHHLFPIFRSSESLAREKDKRMLQQDLMKALGRRNQQGND